LAQTRLLAPLLYPGAIYCAGANYSDHAAEMNARQGRPPDPDPHTLGLKAWHFIKASRAVTHPNATVALPRASKAVDWEAELAAVIGRAAKDVPQRTALDHVAGYLRANDLSARPRHARTAAAGQPVLNPWPPEITTESTQSAGRRHSDSGAARPQKPPYRHAQRLAEKCPTARNRRRGGAGEARTSAQARPHSCFVARRAPSAIASNLAQQIDGWPTRVPSPQSVPASTFSRPTRLA
jgi:hypothetical protein